MATATATVDDHLHPRSLPLIDLRLLSQSELLSLSIYSSLNSSTTVAAQNDDDDEVSTPKIDRSVFNESAGSRKQTFSRLRLAPRTSSQIPPQFPSAAPLEPLDEENSQIISVLKSLLKIQSRSSYTVGNNGQLVPVQVQYKDYLISDSLENKGLQNVPVDVVTFSLKKRKRGRPRKDENRRSENSWVIESASKVNGCRGESNEINIPVRVVACETVKRRPGRPRKDENGNRYEYKVIESESKMNESKGESDQINVAVVNVESSQNIPIDVVTSESRKRGRGRPRKDEYRNGNEFRAIEGGIKVIESKAGSNEIKVPVVSVESSPYTPVAVVTGETTKRRRGRPRKDESRFRNENWVVESGNIVIQSESKNKEVILVGENKEREMVMENKDGVVVDLVALGNAGDPFAAELRRRTEGIDKKEELLRYLDGLKGEWVSRGQKRKIVDASEFGNALPRGWKLMLCIRKKGGHVWLACRRYISPNGQQFASCKEVSSYLLSLFGFQVASQSNAGHTRDGVKSNDKMTSADAALKDRKNGADLVFCSSFPCTPKSTEHEQASLLKIKSPGEVERREILKCHKCSMAFQEQDDLLHHLLSSHQATTKRSKCSIISEGVIIKDGKYECQLCHKLFEDRHRYNGHLGGHIKNYVKRLGGVLTTHKANEPVSVGVPSEFVETQETIGIDWDSFAERTTNFKANNEIISDFPVSKPKADGIVESHSDKYSHECNLLSHDKQIMMPNRNSQTLPQQNFNMLDRVSCITNDKVDKLNPNLVTDVPATKLDVCSGVETVLSTGYSSKSCLFSVERDVPNSAIGGINNFSRRSPQNWSLALGGNDQPYLIDYSVKGAPVSSLEKQKQVIGSQGGFFPSNGMGKMFTCESLQERHFTSTMEDGEINRDKYVRDKAISASNHGCSGLENAAAKVKEQGNFTGYSPVPMEQRCGSENNMNRVSTNILAEGRQERTSASGFPSSSGNKPTFVVNNYLNSFSTSTLDQPNFDDVNRSENNELAFGFGNKHTMNKPGQEEDSEVGLLNLFGSEKIFGYDNNLTKVSAGPMEVSKLDKARNTNEQAHGVENSYKVYTGTVHQESRLENSENARNNDFMTSFGNNGRSGVDVMAELLWRTDDENILLSGLADTSSRLLQSSGCFPAFGSMSDKGESELFSIGEKYDSISGFEGLRSGSIEHMEYDFLTTQTSSHSELPKVLSYDAEISRGFDSSVWLEKEALPLLPKIGSRYQVTMCAWCRNEFNHEPVDTGAEAGSVGFICPTCKAKFSGNQSSL